MPMLLEGDRPAQAPTDYDAWPEWTQRERWTIAEPDPADEAEAADLEELEDRAAEAEYHDQLQRLGHAVGPVQAAPGSAGGLATYRRYGRSHMAAIGRAGFRSTVSRHWQGDADGFLRWLRQRARFSVVECLADLELAGALASGAEVASIELEPLEDDLADVPF